MWLKVITNLDISLSGSLRVKNTYKIVARRTHATRIAINMFLVGLVQCLTIHIDIPPQKTTLVTKTSHPTYMGGSIPQHYWTTQVHELLWTIVLVYKKPIFVSSMYPLTPKLCTMWTDWTKHHQNNKEKETINAHDANEWVGIIHYITNVTTCLTI